MFYWYIKKEHLSRVEWTLVAISGNTHIKLKARTNKCKIDAMTQ